MREISVNKSKNNISLMSYICEIFPNLSYGLLNKALRNKDIKVNEKRVSKDMALNDEDKIQLYITDNILFSLPKELEIVYEDDNILAVFKPQGVLSNDEDRLYFKDIGGVEPTLEDLVKAKDSNFKICHRLDRNTAGILLFAKNQITYTSLMDGFKNGYVHKEYIAYVSNANFKKDHDVLEKYLLKDPKTEFVKVVDQKENGAKKIITEYTVIHTDKTKDYAILKIKLHTGRTHQIRAQMANISHYIIGDSKYGKNDINKKFRMYKQLLFAVNYSFSFDPTSPLYYLNSISVTLDKKHYDGKI